MTEEQIAATKDAIKLLNQKSRQIYAAHVFGGEKDVAKPLNRAIRHLDRSLWLSETEVAMWLRGL